MNCPLCKAEMVEGFTDESLWTARTGLLNKLQGSKKSFKQLGREMVPVIAFRCPKCGKIELDSEVVVKE